MRNYLFATFLLFFSVATNAEVAEQAERLSAKLTDSLSYSFGQLVDMAYSESNITRSESAQIRDKLSAATAVCIVDSLIEQAKEQSLDTEKLLTDAENVLINQNREALSDVLVEEELGNKINICVFHAYEKVGALFP